MSYTINPNAKNKWARNAENTMDLSLETDASSVYLDNGRTLEQEIGEGSMISNVATVDNAMSKVIDGTLDGSYESLMFKGKSLVNTWNKLDTHNKSNFILHDDGFMELKPNVLYLDHIQKSTSCLKPNTKYLLIVEVKDNTLPNDIYVQPDSRTYFYNNERVTLYPPKTNGVTKTLLTTISDFSTTREDLRWGVYIQHAQNNVDESERGTMKIRQMLIEYQEGMENWDIPYFEGMASVKMPILRNVGKNLFDINGKIDPYHQNNYSVRDGVLNVKGTWYVKQTLPLKPNTKYVARLNVKGISGSGWKWAIYCNRTDEYVTSGGTGKWTFTTPSTFSDISILFYSGVGQEGEAEFSNIQIEESSTATTYEEYKTNILRTPEEVVLREVGGVRDTYDALTGEYVQRIGEIILDGSETNWIISGNTVNLSGQTTISFQRPFNGIRYGGNTADSLIINSDKLYGMKLATSTSDLQYDTEYIRPYSSTSENVGIRLLKSKLQTQDVDGLKQYLSQNPITVQYELAEPIVSTIEPLTIPFAYQNGHIILESGYEGQSLLPTLEYSTVVNKTGQIENVAKTIQRQEKQLTMLEKMLIQNIINLDYNNTLLTLKNEMEEML